jgi:hypothetical protein
VNLPHVQLSLDDSARHYRPGDRLAGRFQVDASRPWPIRAAELSVLWYTAGKGEEDFAVHHFERWVDDASQPLELRVPRPFSIELPTSPLSYDGEIVKICWCVRLRIFLPQGQETLEEVAFRLGDVPTAVEV